MVEKKWRPFDSVEDMDECLIERWNRYVDKRDTVWHLGDVGMGSMTRTLTLVSSRLKGTKHLIVGNHDKVWHGNRNAHQHFPEFMESFQSVSSHGRRKILGRQVLLSHLPYVGDHITPDRFEQWRLPNLGLPLLHGHVHTEWQKLGNMLNVGVDRWEFRPVSLGEVAEWVATLPELPPTYETRVTH
jgi:calcineurin-like phosphoesterase family protein